MFAGVFPVKRPFSFLIKSTRRPLQARGVHYGDEEEAPMQSSVFLFVCFFVVIICLGYVFKHKGFFPVVK